MKLRIKQLVLVGLTAFALVGCDPDNCNIIIPVSAIKKANQGGTGFAKAKIFYTTTQDDVKTRLPEIKKLILPYLGDGAKVDVKTPAEGDGKLTANWKIPVASAKTIKAQNAVCGIAVGNGKVEFATLNGIDGVNGALGKVDSTISAGFGGPMSFVITNDTSEDFKIHVFGAFADDKACANEEITIESGEQVTVRFDRNEEKNVYNVLMPMIGL